MSLRRLFSSSVTASLAGALVLAALSGSRPVETHPRITTTLLWQRDIAPIMQRRCFTCHSPDNAAMSLVTFSEARPWAAAIREEILTRHMPLWTAVAGYGRFQNDPSLTQGEWDLIVAWVDGGSPSGQTLEEERQPSVYVPAAATWEHGAPDVVLTQAQATAVPAHAASEVKTFEIETGFTTLQRVHGLAFKPGDRRVVRHAAVYEAGSKRWLFSWTPWSGTMHLPEGVAFTLPAGAKLLVEIGYHGANEAVSDTSEIGLYLDAAAGGAATVQQLQSSPLALEAGAPATRMRTEMVLEETTAIQALWPEPGADATSVELTAFMPDGGVRPLLWLRGYHAEWPSPYVYVVSGAVAAGHPPGDDGLRIEPG